MYTQCPDCLTVFSLDAQMLALARGQVVCGHCQAHFDALASLNSQLPPEPFQQLPTPRTGQAPVIELAVYRPRPEQPVAAAHGPTSEDFSQLKFTPQFARAQPPRERRWPWVTMILVLLLLLGVQLAWADRDALIADPTTGGWLRSACATLNCQLPLVRDVRQLRLLARDVQAHPSVNGALLIGATMRNDAAFDQPYPVVVITLSDVNGKRIAMRRLSPAEYLGDTAQLRRGLPAGASTALLLEVKDPGQQAVAFDFGFE